MQHFLVDMEEAFWSFCRVPFWMGEAAARNDLSRNVFILKTYGKAAHWRDTYARLLQDKYGIRLESVSEEHLSPRRREEIRGYNSVVKRQIYLKRGHDFLTTVVDEAKAVHRTQFTGDQSFAK